MTCEEAHEAILEADVPELDGSGDGPLALHLEMCPRCREMAQKVLKGEAALAEDLLDLMPPLDVDEILRAAGQIPTKKADRAEPGSLLFPISSLRRFRKAGVAILPLAAAAAVAALLLGREPQLPGPAYSPPERVAGLEVAVPEGQNVAVMETTNPDITVLWLF